MEYTMINIK